MFLGYAYDRSEGSLLSEFAPERLHLATTSGPQATGDGVRLGQAAGATLVDMDQVQVFIAHIHREIPPFSRSL